MYRVQVGPFEGPLDLLLFFVKRDEINIYDIPVARITEEFLAYIDLMEELNLDGVADFLYFAALLMSIKAQMLLPRDDEMEEVEDPRQILVDQLLEYIRIREASERLETLGERRRMQFTRGAYPEAGAYASTVEVMEVPSLSRLIQVFQRLMQEASRQIPVHTVETENYTVEEQRVYVQEHLIPGRKVSFYALVRRRSRAFIITTFLAILEMLREQVIRIFLASETDFFLEPA